MKRFLTIFLILFVIGAKAQSQATTNDVALVKEMAVKKYTGQENQLTVEVKSVATDGAGNAGASVLQVGKNRWDFIESSRKTAEKIKNNDGWQKRTITGTIDAGAGALWLYLFTKGDGDFYFDNIEMKVKDERGKWTEVPVENGDFEHSSEKFPLKGLENLASITKKTGVSASISLNEDTLHKRVLHIHSEGAKPDDRIFYGYNKKAGNYVWGSNGVKLYYEVYGTGEPLVLLHGNGGSINSFSSQIPEFAKKYKVIAIDTRGQGMSKDISTPHFSYDLFAEDLKTILDSLHLKNVNIVGWSDGGNTALILASKYPDYVKKLIAMGANLNPSDSALTKKILNTTKKDLQRLKAENKPEHVVIIRLLEMLLKEPNMSLESLNTITAKTLILAGEKDLILEKHTRLIAEHIPKAKLIILKGASHFVVTENPALFNQTALDFLEE